MAPKSKQKTVKQANLSRREKTMRVRAEMVLGANVGFPFRKLLDYLVRRESPWQMVKGSRKSKVHKLFSDNFQLLSASLWYQEQRCRPSVRAECSGSLTGL